MSIDFQIQALDEARFFNYFQMTSDQLADNGAYLFEADQNPCYPCRVSLADAEVGDTVLALSFEHLSVSSPYCSAGPIFVRAGVKAARPEVNEVPQMLQHRLLSVRGYSDRDLMIEAQTVCGELLSEAILQKFQNKYVRYLQLHNAGPGCFNCTVVRV